MNKTNHVRTQSDLDFIHLMFSNNQVKYKNIE